MAISLSLPHIVPLSPSLNRISRNSLPATNGAHSHASCVHLPPVSFSSRSSLSSLSSLHSLSPPISIFIYCPSSSAATRLSPKRYPSAVSSLLFPFISTAKTDPPLEATEQDAFYMRRALELSRKAAGKTSPNPMVGCVIVKDGQVVGEGFHPKAGEPHAEVFALRQAGPLAHGATAYVTLEPCNHQGRTPPCTLALLRGKVGRVVVGTRDPNPLVGGKGIERLRREGVQVLEGVEEESCRRNVDAFVCRIMEKRPLGTLRYTMSLDGKVIEDVGKSGNASGSYYSKLLEEYDAVVVTDKAILSNPAIFSSEDGAKQPIRIILASDLDLPKDLSVFDTHVAPTLVITDENALTREVERSSREGGESAETWMRERGVDFIVVREIELDNVMDVCYQRECSSVLWDCQGPIVKEGGSVLGRRAVEEEVVDKVVVVVKPVVVGEEGEGFGFVLGEKGRKQELESVRTYTSGEDVVIEGYVKKEV